MTVMALWRRVTAMVVAAAVAVSPTLACADFCPPSQSAIVAKTAPAGDADRQIASPAMPEDCADAMNTAAPSSPQTPAHDPDCQGCSDCPAITSVKSPALAFVNAISVEAPALIALAPPLSPVANIQRPARHRLAPPANGPPLAATPILLKDILQL